MKRPDYAHEIRFALLFSAAAGICADLVWRGGVANAPIWLMLAAGGVTLWRLARHVQPAPASTLVAAAWMMSIPASLLLPLGWMNTLILQLLLIWLARTLWLQRTSLPALFDALLQVLALLSTLFVLQRTGSLALATWSLLLLQSLHWFIPEHPHTSLRHSGAKVPDTDFHHAHVQAMQCLRRLHRSHEIEEDLS